MPLSDSWPSALCVRAVRPSCLLDRSRSCLVVVCWSSCWFGLRRICQPVFLLSRLSDIMFVLLFHYSLTGLGRPFYMAKLKGEDVGDHGIEPLSPFDRRTLWCVVTASTCPSKLCCSFTGQSIFLEWYHAPSQLCHNFSYATHNPGLNVYQQNCI